MNVKKYTHKILAYSKKLFNEYLQCKLSLKKFTPTLLCYLLKLSAFSQLVKGHIRASWLQIYCLQ